MDKVYEAPSLKELGTLHELTQGDGIGVADGLADVAVPSIPVP